MTIYLRFPAMKAVGNTAKLLVALTATAATVLLHIAAAIVSWKSSSVKAAA